MYLLFIYFHNSLFFLLIQRRLQSGVFFWLLILNQLEALFPTYQAKSKQPEGRTRPLIKER